MVIISSIRSEAEARGNNPLMRYAFQDEANKEKVEKWHKYYSSFQRILLVGEGDFSFSLCLAKSFGSASNIVATCIDSKAALNLKYRDSKENVRNLKQLGATVLYGVDATKMELHPQLRMMKFDRIVYNFPHAGFHGKEDDVRLIRKHRSLVYGFFANARRMLYRNGEVHVNHKTGVPFSYWNLQELASWNFLGLLFSIDFKIEDYPGYRNKRGDGKKCDNSFPLGKCSTFMFVVDPTAMKMYNRASNLYPAPGRLQTFQSMPFPRDSLRIVKPPPCDPFRIARPPPPDFHVRCPPPHSFGTIPFERETIPFIRPPPPKFHVIPPPPHSFGTIPFERETIPFIRPPPPEFHVMPHPPHSFGTIPFDIRQPPPHSFGTVHFERETVPFIRQPPPPPFGMVNNMRSEHTRYFNHFEEEYGKPEVDVHYLVTEARQDPFVHVAVTQRGFEKIQKDR